MFLAGQTADIADVLVESFYPLLYQSGRTALSLLISRNPSSLIYIYLFLGFQDSVLGGCFYVSSGPDSQYC